MHKCYFSFFVLFITAQPLCAQNTKIRRSDLDSANTNINPVNPNASANKLSEVGERIDVNFLLRSSVELESNAANQTAIRLNEARLEVRGDLTPDLSFRIRYRLNRNSAPNSLDNAPGSIDHANITYQFGNKKNWHLTAGKQAASVGSWEFDRNPTFEYQYTEYVGRQLNLFLLALKLGYEITENQSIELQLHNTYNEDFNTALNNAGYQKNGLKPSKAPLGLYISWLGNMFDQKWQTFYSYNVSQFAKGKTNHSVSIGNKVVLDRFEAYLDLQSANMAVDFPNIASPAVNKYLASSPAFVPAFVQDINYKTAVLRMDYRFMPKWYITTKGFYEVASHRKDHNIGDNFRENIGYWVGIEYKPVVSQEMRLFTYYFYNTTRYNNAVGVKNANQDLHIFAIGVLYFINAL